MGAHYLSSRIIIALIIAIFFLPNMGKAEQSGTGAHGTISATSNYVWRGISLTNNNPALQADLYYIFNNGIYLGGWLSNVTLDPTNSSTPTLETALTIGYSGSFTDNLDYAIGIARYIYPGQPDSDYNEGFVALNYRILSAAVYYSNDVFASGGNGTYFDLGFNYSIPSKYIFNISGFGIFGNIGYYKLDPVAGNSYANYNIGIVKKFGRVSIALTWTDTDGKAELDPLDKGNLVATISLEIG